LRVFALGSMTTLTGRVEKMGNGKNNSHFKYRFYISLSFLQSPISWF